MNILHLMFVLNPVGVKSKMTCSVPCQPVKMGRENHLRERYPRERHKTAPVAGTFATFEVNISEKGPICRDQHGDPDKKQNTLSEKHEKTCQSTAACNNLFNS